MTVQLVCKCGKQLRIPDEHAGRRVMCPGCGASHLSPAADPTAVPAAGGPWPHPPAKGERRVFLLVLFLLLLAGGAGAAWWFLFRTGGAANEGDDLALVPANAQGFISIRVADLWKTPAARKAVKDVRERDPQAPDPTDQMDRDTGLRPEEIERLTLVGVDLDRKIAWGIVRTLQPYDRRRVLSRLKDHRELVYKGKRYYLGLGPDGHPLAIWFAGTRVLVAGSEEGVKLCRDFEEGTPPAGPLTEAIDLAAGSRTAVAGVYPAGGPLETVKADSFLKSLADVKLFTATLDVSEKATLAGKAKMSGEEDARRMVQAIKDNRMAIQFGLGWALLQGGVKGNAARLLQTLLGKMKFVQKGDEVGATATIDEGSRLVELLIAMPGR